MRAAATAVPSPGDARGCPISSDVYWHASEPGHAHFKQNATQYRAKTRVLARHLCNRKCLFLLEFRGNLISGNAMHEPLTEPLSSAAAVPATRFMRAAKLCRARDLERLFALGELVRSLGDLIHGVQRERGASSIVLGSHGANFLEQLDAQIAVCLQLERDVRAKLEQVDAKLDGMSFGARFYTRG